MEIIRPNPAPGRLRLAVFDFDGTLSLIREGWQVVMKDLIVEVLQETRSGESGAELRALAEHPVTRLAGRPTIDQMRWLADEAAKRGGQRRTPDDYKRQYLDRLEARIRGRLDDLKAGRVRPGAWCVPGAQEFVQHVRKRGVTCYLASGSDEDRVRDEATALGLTPLFVEIWGARPDGSFSKKALLERLAAEHRPVEGELAAFGDGPVEIAEAKTVGGLAVGVASNERERRGVDEDKRAQLIEAGADAIVADFGHPDALLAYLWP